MLPILVPTALNTMGRLRNMAGLLILLLNCLPIFAVGQASDSAQNATSFALVYGYPLLAFQKATEPFINFTNVALHKRTLSTAADKTVVRPNDDTIYTLITYDLSKSDLSIAVPAIPDSQFVLFSFYDPFGDNYCNIGPAQFEEPSKYLLRTSPNAASATGVVPSSDLQLAANVYSPSTYGIIMIRWLVNATNLDYIHSLQDNTSLRAVPASTPSNAPLLASLTSIKDTSSTPAQRVLSLLQQLGPWSPPETKSARSLVGTQLAVAGFSNGSYTTPSGIDIGAANKSAIASAASAAIAPGNNAAQNNGWSITPEGLAGSFKNGTAYAYRTFVAETLYLQLQAPLAVYPSWMNASNSTQTSSDGSYMVGPNDAFIYTFSGKPPLKPAGFWSLTAYSDQFLIPNSLDRYSLGDRSNLTYADGNLVYDNDHSDTTTNRPFQILIQPADVPPPDNWTSNWLPSPAGGGSVAAILRWYNGQEELLDGRYEYPIVERRAAITKDANGTSDGAPSTGSATTLTAGIWMTLLSLISALLLAYNNL